MTATAGSRPAAPAESILHVDMDAFYASVEIRERPELTGKPVLVGGTGGRGVVASASYAARALGIGSAMPMARALRLCPDAVVLSPRFDLYTEASHQVMQIFESITPHVEPLSLDEAFLDVSGSVRLFGDPSTIGHVIRHRIKTELDLPASVGIAHNKFLAKLCSGKAKPDGLMLLQKEDAQAFLDPLDVRDLWGVGEKTAERLHRYGVRTVADLRALPEPTLQRLVGDAGTLHLTALARATDPRRVTRNEGAKGIGHEQTFDSDVDDPAVLRRELLRLSEKVARRLRQGGLAGRTITLKLRYANFTTISRSKTLPQSIDDATQIHATLTGLLDALRLERVRVRLIGVRMTNLEAAEAARQLRLTDEDRWQQLEHAADAARDRFGEGMITRGALLDE